MGDTIYEAFVIKTYDGNTPVGYVSSSVDENFWAVKYSTDGKLYDSYEQAKEAMHIIAKHNPEFNFDIEVVFLDMNDMYALCN